MNCFNDYVRREILNLITNQKPHITSAGTVQGKRKGKETPYVTSLGKDDNTYWKIYSREAPIITANYKESSQLSKNSICDGLKRSKSAFYRNLLNAEKILNEGHQTQKMSQQTRKRKDTQETNSTHRRQCLDSHKQARKIQNLINLQLMKRQSSTASDNYLKAKFQLSKRRPISTFESLRIIKI